MRWRGVFYPLITPTFTPFCLAVVVLLLVAPLLYSLESQWDWSYFMLQLPGPQFENSACQFFARCCHMARSGLFFFYSNLFLLKASGGGFFRMWHLGQVKESQLWVQRSYCKWSWKILRTIFMHSSSGIVFHLYWPHLTIGLVCLLIWALIRFQPLLSTWLVNSALEPCKNIISSVSKVLKVTKAKDHYLWNEWMSKFLYYLGSRWKESLPWPSSEHGYIVTWNDT